jgi:hypothetical protein
MIRVNGQPYTRGLGASIAAEVAFIESHALPRPILPRTYTPYSKPCEGLDKDAMLAQTRRTMMGKPQLKRGWRPAGHWEKEKKTKQGAAAPNLNKVPRPRLSAQM